MQAETRLHPKSHPTKKAAATDPDRLPYIAMGLDLGPEVERHEEYHPEGYRRFKPLKVRKPTEEEQLIARLRRALAYREALAILMTFRVKLSEAAALEKLVGLGKQGDRKLARYIRGRSLGVDLSAPRSEDLREALDKFDHDERWCVDAGVEPLTEGAEPYLCGEDAAFHVRAMRALAALDMHEFLRRWCLRVMLRAPRSFDRGPGDNIAFIESPKVARAYLARRAAPRAGKLRAA